MTRATRDPDIEQQIAELDPRRAALPAAAGGRRTLVARAVAP